jgi:alpha-tubulin suppressor-like RCC1 family protein
VSGYGILWQGDAINPQQTDMKRIIICLFIVLRLTATEAARAESTNINVWAWGDNSLGQCDVPSDLTNAIAISAGGDHAIALRADGSVIGWGAYHHGQTNDPSFSDVIAVSAGAGFNLALRANGTVVAWGSHEGGRCDVPPGLSNVVAISASGGSGLAVKSDGSVIGWGTSPTLYAQRIPAQLTNVIGISAGSDYGLALQANGNVTYWNGVNGNTNIYATTNAVDVSAGGTPLIFLADGSVYGQGLSNLVAVSAGLNHSLAITDTGAVLAWGGNSYGQCDIPPNLPRAISLSASGLTGYPDPGNAYSLALVNPSQAGSPPTIRSFPLSQSVAIGSTAYLTVGALGFPPLKYQWYFGTNALNGQTNKVLVLPNLHSSQSGVYKVIVSNPAGETSSPSAFLNILPSLGINMIPAVSLTGDIGSTYELDYINAIAATNMWVSLGNITLTNSPQYFFDISAIGQPARLYRLVQVP